MNNQNNDIQELNLELIRRASFNAFNGENVVKDLIANKDLWEAVIMDRESHNDSINLIKLRDISSGQWNVDTLFILSSGKDDDKLKELGRNWEVDELDWIEGEEANNLLGSFTSTDRRILKLWWD